MNRTNKFDYIIFHKGCVDGFAGFFVLSLSNRIANNAFIYQDVPSATNVPPNIDGKNIIIIDVAYKKNILDIIFTYANSVVFIDHHDSIHLDVIDLYNKYKNDKKKQITIVYNENKCGSTLTWNYLFGKQTIPLFLKYIEDQDIGKWKYEKTKPFLRAVKTYFNISPDSKTLKNWTKLLDKQIIAELIEKGKYMEHFHEHLLNVALPKHTMHHFPSKKIFDMAKLNNDTSNLFRKIGQYKVAVYCGMNCPSTSELGNLAMEKLDCDFVILWVYNLDSNKYVLSMRSTEVNVANICKIFGGGGHPHASACSFISSLCRIEDLFFGEPIPRKAFEYRVNLK